MQKAISRWGVLTLTPTRADAFLQEKPQKEPWVTKDEVIDVQVSVAGGGVGGVRGMEMRR